MLIYWQKVISAALMVVYMLFPVQETIMQSRLVSTDTIHRESEKEVAPQETPAIEKENLSMPSPLPKTSVKVIETMETEPNLWPPDQLVEGGQVAWNGQECTFDFYVSLPDGVQVTVVPVRLRKNGQEVIQEQQGAAEYHAVRNGHVKGVYSRDTQWYEALKETGAQGSSVWLELWFDGEALLSSGQAFAQSNVGKDYIYREWVPAPGTRTVYIQPRALVIEEEVHVGVRMEVPDGTQAMMFIAWQGSEDEEMQLSSTYVESFKNGQIQGTAKAFFPEAMAQIEALGNVREIPVSFFVLVYPQFEAEGIQVNQPIGALAEMGKNFEGLSGPDKTISQENGLALFSAFAVTDGIHSDTSSIEPHGAWRETET